jgi:stage II sporulation protein D
MAGALRSSDAAHVPPQAAFQHAALRWGPSSLDERARASRADLPARLIARPRRRTGGLGQGLLLIALGAALLMLLVSSTDALGATLVTPKCNDVNLRTGPATTYTRKAQVDRGVQLTVIAKVGGGSYGAQCGASYVSGSAWFKISAINGRSVKSLYGVAYLYGARQLFKTVLIAPPASPTPTPTSPPSGSIPLGDTVTFYGRGYGHGVGLSQYGAQGRATDGQLAPEILAHYYHGTTLGTMSNKQIRVLVLQRFAASATNPVQVYGRGATWTVDGVDATFPADARLRFTPTTSGTTTTWRINVTAADGSRLYSGASSSSVRIRPGTGATLQLWSKPSAYDRFRGTLRLIGRTDESASVNVVNALPIETYLRGVIPAEVPASWPGEAVKAQAIAARSYAAYRLHPHTGSFDIYDDTRSQVYLGVLAHRAGSNAAVSATAGVVLRTSDGGIANAMFHSTAGGATENNENVFVSATGEKVAGVFSYLRGSLDRRADGTAYDAASPYATWSTNTYTLADIQTWFAADSRTNVGTLVALDLHDRGFSGRLISVTLIGADGTTTKVAGDVFRAVFNAHRPSADPMLRSTLFDLAPIP